MTKQQIFSKQQENKIQNMQIDCKIQLALITEKPEYLKTFN